MIQIRAGEKPRIKTTSVGEYIIKNTKIPIYTNHKALYQKSPGQKPQWQHRCRKSGSRNPAAQFCKKIKTALGGGISINKQGGGRRTYSRKHHETYPKPIRSHTHRWNLSRSSMDISRSGKLGGMVIGVIRRRDWQTLRTSSSRNPQEVHRWGVHLLIWRSPGIAEQEHAMLLFRHPWGAIVDSTLSSIDRGGEDGGACIVAE